MDIPNSKLLETITTELRKEGDRIRAEIKTENKKLIERIDKAILKINNLEEKYTQIENKYLYLERQIRKNNILIYGLKLTENINIVDFVLNFFREVLEVELNDCHINNVYKLRIGREYVIKVELLSSLVKEKILKNCKKLKGKEIYINSDLCYKDRQEQKILRRHLKLARSKNYNAKIRGRFLEVNSEKYSVDQLRDMENRCETDTTDSNSPGKAEKIKAFSEPPTPTQASPNTFFEDSLGIFTLNSPLPLEKTLSEETPKAAVELAEASIEEGKKNNELEQNTAGVKVRGLGKIEEGKKEKPREERKLNEITRNRTSSTSSMNKYNTRNTAQVQRK